MPVTLPKLSERVVAVDDLTFTVGPETFDSFSASLGFIRRNDLSGPVAGLQGAAYMMARRIRAWTGVMVEEESQEDGSIRLVPAACTEQAKMVLFAAHPNLLDKILIEHARQEDDDRKNSKPTP